MNEITDYVPLEQPDVTDMSMMLSYDDAMLFLAKLGIWDEYSKFDIYTIRACGTHLKRSIEGMNGH